MRNIKKKTLQNIMSEELKQYRQQHGLSQEAMARKLMLAVRTYVDLEHGINLASATTLAIYLTQLPPNEQERFLQAVRTAWES